MSETGENGKVFTFYSYKGGVGRSMALANTAVLLAQWGYKTLIIDWDLEAPGLENYFKPYLDISTTTAKPGLIEILSTAGADTGKVSWQNCVVPVKIPGLNAPLDIITSGIRNEKYYEKVRGFDIKYFYTNQKGGNIIEQLRDEWKDNYDCILLDSRTGVTDSGGICTIQLPDILVLLFTPTEYGFNGILDVARKATAAHQVLPYDRLGLLCLPVPARVDKKAEFAKASEWLKKFELGLAPLYNQWLPLQDEHGKKIDRYNFLERTYIPQVPFYSFGENLPVLEEGVVDPTSMGYTYQTIAALLATGLNNAGLVLEDRDRLIRMAGKIKETEPAVNAKQEAEAQIKKPFYKKPVFVGACFVVAILLTFLLTMFIGGGNGPITAENPRKQVDILADSIASTLKKGDTARALYLSQEFSKTFLSDSNTLYKNDVLSAARMKIKDTIISKLDAFYSAINDTVDMEKYFAPAVSKFYSVNNPGRQQILEKIKTYRGRSTNGISSVLKDSLVTVEYDSAGYKVRYTEEASYTMVSKNQIHESVVGIAAELDPQFRFVSIDITKVYKDSMRPYTTRVDIFYFKYDFFGKEIADKLESRLGELPSGPGKPPYKVFSKFNLKQNHLKFQEKDNAVVEIRYGPGEKPLAEKLAKECDKILQKVIPTDLREVKSETKGYLSIFIYTPLIQQMHK